MYTFSYVSIMSCHVTPRLLFRSRSHSLFVAAVEFIQWDSQMSTEMTVMLSPHQGSPPDSSLVVSITSFLKPWNSVVGTLLCYLMVPQPNMYLFEWSELSYTPKNGTWVKIIRSRIEGIQLKWKWMSKSFLKVIWNIQTWDKLMRFWLMLLRKMKILMHTVDKKNCCYYIPE